MIKPEIFDTNQSLYEAAAEYFIECYETAVSDHGSFHVALSGGSTPKKLYQLLATDPYIKRVNWQNIHFYFGDERFVAHDSDESNYKMAKASILDSINCPMENIHPVNTALESADEAASDYAELLSNDLPKVENHSVFDLVLLGLGTDGHTASLFPDTDILSVQDRDCASVYVKKMESWRISLTFPIINRAKHIILISDNVTKSDIVKSLIEWDKPEAKYPIQQVEPQHEMRWLVDRPAAMFI